MSSSMKREPTVAFIHKNKYYIRRGDILYVDGVEFGAIIGDHVISKNDRLFGILRNGTFQHVSELFETSSSKQTKTSRIRRTAQPIVSESESESESDEEDTQTVRRPNPSCYDFQYSKPTIVQRKPIADLKRALYQRFALPVAQYIQQVEEKLPTSKLRDAFRNHMNLVDSFSYGSMGVGAGFRTIDIEGIYKSIMMTIPEEESILSVNGCLMYYPSKMDLNWSENTLTFAERKDFHTVYEQFTILIETEKFIYECKPSMTFKYLDNRSQMEVYVNTYPDRMDKHQRFLNHQNGYMCLKNAIPSGNYYRIRGTQIPYCVQRFPKQEGIVLETHVDIHELPFEATVKDFDAILQKDYESLTKIRNDAGICVARSVTVYDD